MDLWQLFVIFSMIYQHPSSGLLTVSPFFFLCNYHGNVQDFGVERGEVAISVSVEGNPHFYVPGKFYQVTVSSSMNFDGFLLTGLYTLTSEAQTRLMGRSFFGIRPMGQSLMCSIVHSHVSMQPVHELTFMWMAPPADTGCVSFLATATLGQQLLFKDTTVFQMCEEGAATTSPLRPELAEIHTDAVILRDDFDSQPDFRTDLWQRPVGGSVSDKCGTVMFDQSALFCEKEGIREMITVPLNTTSAKVVQFAISAGSCGRSDSEDRDIRVMYGVNGCTEWVEIERMRPPVSSETEIHLLTLPKEARREGVCLRWIQTPYPDTTPHPPTTAAPIHIRTADTHPTPSEVPPPSEVHPSRPSHPTTRYHLTDTAEHPSSDTIHSATEHIRPSSEAIHDFDNGPTTTTVSSASVRLTHETSHTAASTSSAAASDIHHDEIITSSPTIHPSTSLPTSTPSSVYEFTSEASSSSSPPPPTTTSFIIPSTTTQSSVTSPPPTPFLPNRIALDEPPRPPSYKKGSKTFQRDPSRKIHSKGLFRKLQSDGTKYRRRGRRDIRVLSVAAFKSCWAIDNVLVVNIAHPPTELQETFDPVDPSNLLFFPGGNIRQTCQSDSNVMTFMEPNQTHNYIVTRDLDLQSDVNVDSLLYEQFESGVDSQWRVKGGTTNTLCGVVDEFNALVFVEVGKRQVCTDYMDLSAAGNLRFAFGIGVGGCHSSEKAESAVQVYVEDRSGSTFFIEKLKPEDYRHVKHVSLPLTLAGGVTEGRICWIQKFNTGAYRDIWVLDAVTVLPYTPTHTDAVVQFSLNMECGTNIQQNRISLEYSTDHGDTWYTLHEPCLTGDCDRMYQPLSTTIHSRELSGWTRFTFPIPYVALTPYTRFRWMQKDESGSSNWAIDNVFIGSCPVGCSNHGTCEAGQCSCDFGYTGPSCRDPVVPGPTSFRESFEDSIVVTSSLLFDIRGASVTFDCGVISSGKSLVFNGDGPRDFVTIDLNTTNAQYLQYSVRVGSLSTTSDCPPPDDVSEAVYLEYSCNGGITWNFLRELSIKHYQSPRGDAVYLPDSAHGPACRFRWRQPHHSGHGQDVWAIDEVSLTKELTNTLSIEVADMKEMNEKLTANLGKLTDTYCGAPKSITFAGRDENGRERFLMSEAMQIGPSYMIQFDLVMGCHTAYAKDIDNRLYLEFSVDHGSTWDLVQEPCLPPMLCDEYHAGTLYDVSQYPEWTRTTVLLPEDTWSPGTKFRWRQPEWSPSDSWAIKRIYIGQQCPFMCHGHGQCNEGVCKCDPGFSGESCTPANDMDTDMHADFGMRYEPDTDFHRVTGGEVVRSNEGCGPILSGESIYFSKDGVRELQTKDMDTGEADYIQFYIRLGGEEQNCNGADERSESVLLQFSVDGGITWQLLEEIHHTEYNTPRFVHIDLPDEAQNPSTRFRWWQPSHSGQGHDQWAVDEIIIGQYERRRFIKDSFEEHPDPLDSGNWLTVTEGVVGKYCQQTNPGLVLGNQPNDKIAVTKDLVLEPEDVIQFRINVGCGKIFRWDHPVYLRYSHDGGRTWELVVAPCYQQQDCDGRHTEGSIYYTGTHGEWSHVVIPVTKEIAMHPVIFQWYQPGGMSHSFALDDVYIGPPCPRHCLRNGLCNNGTCDCFEKSSGPDCQSDEANPSGMLDRFDNRNQPTAYWQRILGGYLGRGCGVVEFGNSLYFNDDGTREAVTDPLDTTGLRMLQFVLKIGSEDNRFGCRQPENRDEGIVVDYSTDNQITWKILKVIEPQLYNGSTQVVVVELPADAKTNHTTFRWWQPLGHLGVQRAEWALDSVLIGINDTSTFGFQDDFSSMMPDPHNWFIADSAVPRLACNSQGNALEFSTNKGLRFAETWDYQVTPSTFLQFDIAMGCGSLYGTLYSVMLEYSVNMGKTWHPVVSECKPPNFECSGYHLSSQYASDQHMNWTRVTVYLPPGAVSPATRFRWLQHTSNPRGTVWALDNVYLGNGCPWLCSGHGYCNKGTCVCDEGFTGAFCVPAKPLPMMLRDDFNSDKVDQTNWREVYGGEPTDVCGNIVSGNALTFHKDQLRMAVTRDIDTSMLSTVEFSFQYGCHGKQFDWPRTHSVLLQYSTNGGITWKLLKELHYRNDTGVSYFTVPLPMNAKMNATRFRFWQPESGGEMQATWSVDNLFIGTMPMNPNTLYDDFDSGQTDSEAWLFVNSGHVGEYCQFNRRKGTFEAGDSALVFRRSSGGELSAVTRDIDIGPMSALQFDINVGCGSEATNKYPVVLEYSADHGKTWAPLVPNCAKVSSVRCFDSTLPQTVYYGGTSPNWRRVVVPLDNLHVCGALRFRWYQGTVPEYDFAPEWAIDNVYVGMACVEHCNGHGICVSGMACMCDDGYSGETCVPDNNHPTYLKEDFNLPNVPITIPVRGDTYPAVLDASRQLNKERWSEWSGGEASDQCGSLFTEPSLHYGNTGDRILATNELDLSRVSTVQFYLKLGCYQDVQATPPIFLQYSVNGGINWHTIEQFDFGPGSNKPEYIALHLPYGARSNATQLRWWQPSADGTYPEDWAIDQIYIGGDIYGEVVLQDEPGAPRDSSWLMYPGGDVEKVCDNLAEALHFNGLENMRYAISADVDVREGSFLQFDIAVGCEPTEDFCYHMDLEFSLDMGKTWSLLQRGCLPSNVDCSSYFSSSQYTSDLYAGWNRVTIPLPYYTRSKSTRFRWQQPTGFTPSQSWALAHLYIGSECKSMCSGHGRCLEGACVCDDGWTDSDCRNPTSALPDSLVDDFSNGADDNNWLKLVGGKVTRPCKTLANGKALHFAGSCNRVLITHDLDLSKAMFIQFYFLFGCNSVPVKRDQSVLVDYSADGGITWIPITELYYNLYRVPTFINIRLPPGAKKSGVRIRWWQPEHGGHMLGDWVIDSVRINGEEDNPTSLHINTTDILDHENFPTSDNLELSDFCGDEEVVVGKTKDGESSTLTSREVKLKEGAMLQFYVSVGCGVLSNTSVSPLTLQYSTDHGMTWYYLNSQCLPSDPECRRGAQMPTVYYGHLTSDWQRVVIPLNGLPVSTGTRFQWVQHHDGSPTPQPWGIKNIYIGPSCLHYCSGHGRCEYPECICDEGYSGDDCNSVDTPRPTQLKDTFDKPGVDHTKWTLVQSGDIQDGCSTIVEGTSLVFDGPGQRLAVTRDLDLRNAKFMQYTAMIGGQSIRPGCYLPSSRDQSVILQFSIDGGITWTTLHTLDYATYLTPRQDYLPLPEEARTESTRFRWWQPLPSDPNTQLPLWALDNVLIGGTEINPSHFVQKFNDTMQQDATSAYEFSPHGKVQTEICSKEDAVLSWKEGRGVRKFTTNQLIVQTGYMLQFKIVVGCSQHYNVCEEHAPVHLEYNKNPQSGRWQLVQPLCLPDNNHMECKPQIHHQASVYSLSDFPTWTRVTIDLPDRVFSGSTRFRWIQSTLEKISAGWALDDIYVGEKCPNLCSGRGDCVHGHCECDDGYYGRTCRPKKKDLPTRMYESFEGGIFSAHWDAVTGGGIGFGCGALLPYAHGKTLYFSDCGTRQAVTAEMDMTAAVKIIFVMQIGCRAQTEDCNVKLGSGPDYRGILLQYSTNKGSDWKLIARHDPEDFMKPRRMAYDVPYGARAAGTQFRWWQPIHDGAGFDQWAIDKVEIISGRLPHSQRNRWTRQ